MGYTHYWHIKADFTKLQWSTIIQDIKKIYESPLGEQCLAYEYNQPHRPPIADEKLIRFNGKGDEGHETFYISRDDRGFGFCKTAYKGYDDFVVMALTILKNRAPKKRCYIF